VAIARDRIEMDERDQSDKTRELTLLYATDAIFGKSGGRVYYVDTASDKYWQRYLETFDRIIVVGREGNSPVENKNWGQLPSSHGQLEFRLFPNLSSLTGTILLRGKARRQIADLAKSADVVLGRLHSELGLIAVKEARRQGKVWAVEMASCAFDCLWNYGHFKAKLYAPIMFWRTRHAVRSAPVAIYVTQTFLQNRYPCEAGRSYAVSDVALPAPSKEVLERRIKKIKSNGKCRLGIVASLGPAYKGIKTILKALQWWPINKTRIELHILGTGSPDHWKKMAKTLGVDDIVYFSRSVPPGESVARWLDEIDIYLQPSLAEGLPRALIEAMSRGCPAIASNVGGIPELLSPTNLIPPDDHRMLRQKLLEGVGDKNWQVEQADRNWRKAEEFASPSLRITRLEALKECADLVQLS